MIIGSVVLLLAALVMSGNPFGLETAEAQNFDNARVADFALAELGTVRQVGWNQPGECIKSAQRWVANAGGYFGPGGVISGYTNSGAVQVSAGQAAKGDIVQWTNGNDNDWSHPHTVCIVQNYGNGRYWIVQSNWDAPGLVSENKNWDPDPQDYGRYGYYPMFWRFGNVASPTPPPITGGHDVVGATSPASTFYFAEGTCRPGFDPYFCIQNPGGSAADVTLTYMRGDGTSASDTVTVAPHSRSTVSPLDKLGTGNDAAHDFSTRVACTNGQQIVAERPMYFNYSPSSSSGATAAEVQQGASNQLGTQLGWTGGHDVVGATSPSSTFYFAEGTCRPNFDTYFCIQNPNSGTASVTLTYMRGDGTSATDSVTVPKNSRITVSPRTKLGTGNDAAHDFSTRVACTNGQQIVAERPMYFSYK